MDTNTLLIGVIVLIVVYFAYKKYSEGFLERQMNGNLQLELASSRNGAVIENFLEKQMNGNLQLELASSRNGAVIENFSQHDRSYADNFSPHSRSYESFGAYQGSYDDAGGFKQGDARFNEEGAGVYTEFLRASVDPSLNSRQTNFIKDMNNGDLYKTTYSAVNTAKYVARESESPPNTIGLRPARRVPIDNSQKQVPETLPEDSYAAEDPTIAASVLGIHRQW